MTGTPQPGQMILYDCVEVPLVDGSYRLTVETAVENQDGAMGPPFSQERYFDVVGPRFTIPQAMIAAMVPPKNGHGNFESELPHIVLARRSLPWERKLDPHGRLAQPPLAEPVPWMALLVFEENEYKLLRNIPLQQAVPADVFQRLGSPANVLCDAVEANAELVQSILPSLEELQLLAHVRQVNVGDRELNMAGGDGFYAVVVSNRLPTPSAQCCAVLVSLEERSDLVQVDPPPTAVEDSSTVNSQSTVAKPQARTAADPLFVGPEHDTAALLDANGFSLTTELTKPPLHVFDEFGFEALWLLHHPEPQKVRLVALASWQFTCEGKGTFFELMQNLDVGIFGTAKPSGHPAVTDTGHLRLTLQDRVGAPEDVWYRSPLVSSQLARDTLGPYHCADQARRVTPDTGAEDITYAAAFEVGRLLAVADARFAQAAMRWRRESYKQSMRLSTLGHIAGLMPFAAPADPLHTPMTGIFAAGAAQQIANSNPKIADAYGLAKISAAPGLQSGALAAAWSLNTQDAANLLGADAGTLGSVVTAPQQTARMAVTINSVSRDTASLDRLSTTRQQSIDNAAFKLGGE